VTPIEWTDTLTGITYNIPDYNPFDEALVRFSFDECCAYVGLAAELRAQRSAREKAQAGNGSDNQRSPLVSNARNPLAPGGVPYDPNGVTERNGQKLEGLINKPEDGAYIVQTPQGGFPVGQTQMLTKEQIAAIKAEQKRRQEAYDKQHAAAEQE
jgi:hypothetical protein